MPYPREIYLGEELENELAQYIENELINYYADTDAHLKNLIQWQKDYWAEPTKKVAEFPFRNASTIVIPLSAIAVEAVHARTETKLLNQPQLVVAQSLSDEWDAVQKPLEDFMNRQLLDVMKIRRPLSHCFLEAEKFGTMWGKTGYERLVRRVIRTVGEEEQEFEVVYKDGPCFDAVSDSRFLIPYYATDIETAPWVGEEHSETPYAVEQMELAGLFRPGTIIGEDAKLRPYITETMSEHTDQMSGKDYEREMQELENTKPTLTRRIDWVELWLAWPTDDTGIARELVVHFHRESRTFMSIRYNYLSDGRRPYRGGVYFPVEHRIRGIGICKMNEQFQREVTVQHRQRIDNATLVNMRMFKIHKLAGYGPNEPIFPGKIWFVDSMDQIDTIQMGEIYPSSYNNEQSAVIYSQQRTGVNEVTLGMPQVGTPGTATSDLARIQEGQQKFDLWYSNAREFTDAIIMDTADLIQQFGPRNLEYFNTASNGKLVKAFFELPNSYIRDGIVIKLRTSSQQINKILDRQNWQQIAGFVSQYYQGLVQLAAPLGNPQILQLIFSKGLTALNEAMRQILETYDVRNIDRIIVKEIDQILSATSPGAFNVNGLESVLNRPGNTGIEGLNPEGGMDLIQEVLGRISGRSENLAGAV